MRFLDRKQFLYDPAVFIRKDVGTALRIYREYCVKHSPIPYPTFFEVDRDRDKVDSLWHTPSSPRTTFSRELQIPVINQFEKPDWRLTALGIVPQRRDKFYLANLLLEEYDYFPVRGDQVYFNGYRYMIEKVVIEPEQVWQQSGVWLGLLIECFIPPEGDARPLIDISKRAPSEKADSLPTQPLPEPIIEPSAIR